MQEKKLTRSRKAKDVFNVADNTDDVLTQHIPRFSRFRSLHISLCVNDTGQAEYLAACLLPTTFVRGALESTLPAQFCLSRPARLLRGQMAGEGETRERGALRVPGLEGRVLEGAQCCMPSAIPFKR